MDKTLITPKAKKPSALETGSGEDSGWIDLRSTPQIEKSFATAASPQEPTYNATTNPLTVEEIAPIKEGKRSPPPFPPFTEADRGNWDATLIHYDYPDPPQPDKPVFHRIAAIGPRSRINDINWDEVDRLKEAAEVEAVERREKMKRSTIKGGEDYCGKNVEVIDVGDIVTEKKPDFFQFWKWMF